MRLRELQRAFQARILSGDAAILAELNDSPRTDRARLMRVYEHAYGARLAEVLEGDYEKLPLALGPDRFLEMAAGYVAAYPSTGPNARHFGRHLPRFLAETPPWSAEPWLAELAALEWAMSEVFAAPDPPRLALEAMAALHPHDWPTLRLIMAPDARRLDCRHGGPEAWLALDAGETPAPETAIAPTPWLVWRASDARASFRQMTPDEACIYDQARVGAPFAALCDALLAFVDATEAATLAAGYLRVWIEAGLVSGYEAGE